MYDLMKSINNKWLKEYNICGCFPKYLNNN
jgi:hypothetical protein